MLMAEIWLEMVVKRQLVSLLLFETPSSKLEAKAIYVVKQACVHDKRTF